MNDCSFLMFNGTTVPDIRLSFTLRLPFPCLLVQFLISFLYLCRVGKPDSDPVHEKIIIVHGGMKL